MKILIVGTAYPYRGGLATYNERLATEFVQQGHQVEIYTFTLQYPSILFPGKTQYSEEKASSNLIIKRKVNSINPFNWINVGYEIAFSDFELVIFRFWLPFMAPCFGTIARLGKKNKKIIAIVDNIIPHEKRIGDNCLARYFVRSIDACVTMSRAVLNDLEKIDQSKPKIFSPHPLYDNFGEKLSKEICCRKLNLSSNPQYILFFGIIRDYKGLDLLLKAFADKRLEAMNIKLLVVGEFYCSSKIYFDLAKTYKLENRIIWHNTFVPNCDVKYFFNIADIVVQPYKSATQSGVTQIAYHFEKPLLVTNVGGLTEFVPNGKVGYTVNCSPEDIANALVDFYQHQRSSLFCENIVEEKKKYTWQRMTQTIFDLLKKI